LLLQERYNVWYVHPKACIEPNVKPTATKLPCACVAATATVADDDEMRELEAWAS